MKVSNESTGLDSNHHSLCNSARACSPDRTQMGSPVPHRSSDVCVCVSRQRLTANKESGKLLYRGQESAKADPKRNATRDLAFLFWGFGGNLRGRCKPGFALPCAGRDWSVLGELLAVHISWRAAETLISLTPPKAGAHTTRSSLFGLMRCKFETHSSQRRSAPQFR